MAYWEFMRRFGPIAAAAACVVMAACSPSNKESAGAPAAAKNEHAPDVFQVDFDTSKGKVVVEVHRDWAPNGVDHFYTLVKMGFYDGSRFYRTIRNFVAQFGIAADPKTNALWQSASIPDDPVKEHNTPGTLTYAATGMPNSRTTQLFFNLKDNSESLDSRGFAPIGKVITGLDVVESFYTGYGQTKAEGGEGPDPAKIEAQGNAYLESQFPRLDFVKKASIQ
jgi:peptidyl-prolyl cis-trans isomerase A (cyclophilin A)